MNTLHSLLLHPDVRRSIASALIGFGLEDCDIDDGVQDVHVKLLAYFRNGARLPEDLRAMRSLVWKVAKHHALDSLRTEENRARILGAPCEPDEYGLVEHGGALYHPIDARRQLEVLADLFREGRMPEHGVDILEGVASGCSYREVGEDLGISDRAVEGRLRTMRRAFRERMTELGLAGGEFPPPLPRLVGAVLVLRGVA